ncbi:monovalent cation/H+ antiporter subunit C [Thermosipho melanesiensis]|nr:monovalent cation/H+ antiporter subunit C [Thermosipho melanesiensis]OOC36926.1 monovalent cation/H+ antiporter subunit C [Thermosipho melanesiensis]OOC37677.1 monovalent cation/H+ antiporter subunit C [Thermosipho melanesiensis]OOC40906.1 monovalent cation/H+ antiporter subunit C [Thermosipho melanesiensis]OOC42900.1 monovalent cation/H+ antiporter subunit C [Thermosipho melanesiensis]
MMMIYYISFLLIGIGIYGLLTQKNLFKYLVSLTIIDTAINLFIISIGYINGKDVPIFSKYTKTANFVDPLPQALVLTAIVIGVGTLALGTSLLIRTYEKYSTLDVEEIAQKEAEE